MLQPILAIAFITPGQCHVRSIGGVGEELQPHAGGGFVALIPLWFYRNFKGLGGTLIPIRGGRGAVVGVRFGN